MQQGGRLEAQKFLERILSEYFVLFAASVARERTYRSHQRLVLVAGRARARDRMTHEYILFEEAHERLAAHLYRPLPVAAIAFAAIALKLDRRHPLLLSDLLVAAVALLHEHPDAAAFTATAKFRLVQLT